MKYHSGDHQKIRPLVWNMPVNPKGGFNKETCLCKVSAVVSHWSAEPIETFGHYKHGCGTLTSLLAWFDSLSTFFVFKNKITVMIEPLPVLKFQEQLLMPVSMAAEIYTLRRGLF
jgi:hypothetical protein